MIATCIAQLKKNKEEIKDLRKPSECILSYPIITSKSIMNLDECQPWMMVKNAIIYFILL